MFKRALVSVSDKTGLAEALKPLVAQGLEIVSTGGTSTYLKSNGFKVTDVAEVTNFPEVLGGRVKTLHPRVHMGLLALTNNSDHQADLKKHNVEVFDLLICNLYAFEETVRSTTDLAERIEHIDIGGVTLLRAAAKNFQRIAVVSDPSDYSMLRDGSLTEEQRRELAVKAYLHTSNYDMQIAQALTQKNSLRYGENPHQKSLWLHKGKSGFQEARIHQGKELSYNNLLDLDAATRLVKTLKKKASVIVKHNNPCGVGQADDGFEAFKKSFESDSISSFGGIVAVNFSIDKKTAELMTSFFLECVLAPQILPEALEVFKAKKNLRILEWPGMLKHQEEKDIRSIAGGFLVQDQDVVPMDKGSWKVYLPSSIETADKLSSKDIEDIEFGISVVASLKSNAIAVVKDGTTLGLGMGQVNRVDSVKLALTRWDHFHPSVTGAVLVGDAFFPFPDSIEMMDPKKVRMVVQPGGSVKDNDVIQKAREKGIIMVMTGQRNFRH